MAIDQKVISDLQEIMNRALLEMQDLVSLHAEEQEELIPIVNTFLLAVISSAADLVEAVIPGGAVDVYADVEAVAKFRGVRSIVARLGDKFPQYSVSGIDEDDLLEAANYLGHQLLVVLTKAMYELPGPLRRVETQLYGLEILLANLLYLKSGDPHELVENFCAHVHTALNTLEAYTTLEMAKIH